MLASANDKSAPTGKPAVVPQVVVLLAAVSLLLAIVAVVILRDDDREASRTAIDTAQSLKDNFVGVPESIFAGSV